jgi:hypothetical protein
MTWDNFITIASIGWVIWQLVRIRAKAQNSELIIVPFVSSTLIFALIIPLVIITGASPFHLIWLFPASFALSIILLPFSFWTRIVMTFVTVLAKMAP